MNLELLRSDIREGKVGTELTLTLVLRRASDCSPIKNAAIDVWHCDADGVYSGFPGQLGGLDTTGEKFLRGTQITDASGQVLFVTLYPGSSAFGAPTSAHVLSRAAVIPACAQSSASTGSSGSCSNWNDEMPRTIVRHCASRLLGFACGGGFPQARLRRAGERRVMPAWSHTACRHTSALRAESAARLAIIAGSARARSGFERTPAWRQPKCTPARGERIEQRELAVRAR